MAEQTPIGAGDGIIQTQQVGSSTGPFAVDFPFFGLDDVIVVITPDSTGVSTTLMRGVDYALAATANGDGIFPSGVVTLTVAVANTLVTRYRATPLSRVSQIPKTGYLDRVALNADLNRMMVAMQDFDRRTGLYIRLPDEDGTATVTLPPAAQRAGQALIFNAQGDAYVGSIVTVSIVLGTYMTTDFLLSTSAAAARTSLGVPALNATNAWTGAQTFSNAVTLSGAAVVSGTLAVPTAAPGDSDTSAASTHFVTLAIAAALSGIGGVTTAPVIVQLTAGSGTWTVPANASHFEAELIGGGGAGGGSGAGNNGGTTTFDGITALGGTGGDAIDTLDSTGTPGRGGTGGTGGSGSGSATTVIRRGGAPGDMGSFASSSTPKAFGGDGAEARLGGAPGRGGTAGVGSAAAANSGAGGGGYGSTGGSGGGGGGGAGEYVLAHYETVGVSYTYTVGAGAAGSANSAAGGTGYIRIRCYFNY